MLPSGSPARLETLDVAGRVWLAGAPGSGATSYTWAAHYRRAYTGCDSRRAVARCLRVVQ